MDPDIDLNDLPSPAERKILGEIHLMLEYKVVLTCDRLKFYKHI